MADRSDSLSAPTSAPTLPHEDPLLTVSFPEHISTYASPVIHAGHGRVRKSSNRVRIEEGKALQFARSIGLPVPEVFSIVSNGDSISIEMEHIDGQTLENAWPSLDLLQKRKVAADLKQILSTMRRAAPTQRAIGAIEGTVRDCRQYTDHFGGPFAEEGDFNLFVLDFLKGTPKMIKDSIGARMRVGSRLVFTHGDLSPRNIMIQDGHIKALLDWEYAGWYPEYWEFVKFFERPTPCKDWKDYAEDIFETAYPHELITFQALARWHRP